jgi:tRNA pseudouridine55 synthase
VVDKPPGLTSHDVVGRVRRLAGTRKVGHAGTLDPMATGVLVLGINRATRLLTFLVGADKEYLATIRLGVATSTDDAEGEVTAVADASAVTPDRLAGPIAALTGDICQVPSSVSAIKVDGRRAYARVRAGEQVDLPARPVTVSRFELLAQRRDEAAGTVDLDVLVACSSGTYVRALARDLGLALGVGGHLTALRRTRVGPYELAVARTLEQLGEQFEVLPMAQAAATAFPVWTLDADSAARLLHGQRLPATAAAGYPVPDDPAGAGGAPDPEAVADAGPPGVRASDVELPDQTLPDQAAPDQALPDQAAPDQALPDQALPDEALPDEALPDQALPDQALPDQAAPARAGAGGPGVTGQPVAALAPDGTLIAVVVRAGSVAKPLVVLGG